MLGCEKPVRVVSVKTDAVTEVSFTSCKMQGTIVDIGEEGIDEHGFCYALSEEPAVDDLSKKLGPTDATSSFTGILTGLLNNTSYYIRAFAKNSIGVYYGEQLSFTTLAFGLASLTTNAITDITTTSATVGGNITDEGGDWVSDGGVYYGTSVNPETTGTKLKITSGAGEFSTTLSGLTAGTRYYVKAYATNSVGTSYGTEESFVPMLIDSRDGNVYNTVKIGDQWWMAENLKYLPSVVGPATESETIPYYYVYDYDGSVVSTAKASANYTTYGVLYNWTAAMNSAASSTANPSGVQGICPTGWHLPSHLEWTQLTDYLGGEEVAGGKLKETGTSHWDDPNTGATNETGFTALPGGFRGQYGDFIDIGIFGNWLSATEDSPTVAHYRDMGYNYSNVFSQRSNKEYGISVRCVRD